MQAPFRGSMVLNVAQDSKPAMAAIIPGVTLLNAAMAIITGCKPSVIAPVQAPKIIAKLLVQVPVRDVCLTDRIPLGVVSPEVRTNSHGIV